MKSISVRSIFLTVPSMFSILVVFLAGNTVAIAKEQSFLDTSGKQHIEVCHLTWKGKYKLMKRHKSVVLGHLMHHESDKLPVNGACVEPVAYEIGDTGPGGGVVFDVTDNGLHGMEVGPDVLPHFLEWGCVGTNIPGADGTAVGTGAQNTQDILAGCSTPGIIARRVDEFEWGSRTDWFLPSTGELLLIYERLLLTGLSDFGFCFYHSSSERDVDTNLLVNFCQGAVTFALKWNVDDIHILPVRTF